MGYISSKLISRLSPKLEVAFLQSALWVLLVGGIVLMVFDAALRVFSWAFILVDMVLIFIAGTGLYFAGKLPAKKLTVAINIILATAVGLQATQIPEEGIGIAMAIFIMLGVFSSLMFDGRLRTAVVLYLFLWVFAVFGLRLALSGNQENLPTVEVLRVSLPYAMVFLISVLSPAVLKEFYRRQQEILRSANIEIYEKNEEIQLQHEQLRVKNNSLSHLNAQLEKLVEEKTNNISQRDSKISNYAFANAHGIRGHMARILGLLNLIEIDSQDRDALLNMLDDEAKKMDNTISDIGKQLYEHIEAQAENRKKGKGEGEISE